MRVLLVHPLTPKTYWGFQYSVRIAGKSVALPPLGLASLAALLPREWELRIADLNLAPLRDEQIRWADTVMVTGMLVHSESIHRILAQAHSVGRSTFLGGPAATAMPDQFPDADYVFCGEAEGRLGPLLKAVSVPGTTGRILAAKPDERPEMSAVPAPRFDLLDHRQYSSMSIQYSRGCPFRCEFCDIIEVFGRRPRVKTADQLLSEMGFLYRTGYRGPLFFVDDNSSATEEPWLRCCRNSPSGRRNTAGPSISTPRQASI